ncbi:MAG: DUF2959 domain-containing protein [Phycisphaerales bacterium]
MTARSTSARRGLTIVLLAATCGVTPLLAGCASTRIALKERFGYAKREQLVDRVEDARDAQEVAKEQFNDALEAFLSITGVDGGELEKRYNALKGEYDSSRSRADAVNNRIGSVEDVATALFREWNAELEQYESATLRRSSEQSLRETERRYDQLIGAMQDASSRMDPVLAAMNDQVLFLKHNLNARAIASLSTELGAIESEVGTLIREMEASIAEANAFIDELQADNGG